MTRRILVLAGLLLGAAAGCTSSSQQGPIDYRSSGGFGGGGEGAPMHIEADGTATRPRADGGTQTMTLDAATVEDLHNKITDAQLSTLQPMYLSDTVDDVRIDLAVALDAQSYHITADLGAAMPSNLRSVLDTLRQIALDWQ